MGNKIRIEGATSGNVAEVGGDQHDQLKIIFETDANGHAANIGDVRVFGEADAGLATVNQAPFLLGTEVSAEFRERDELDVLLDEESFGYSAQNTTKHRIDFATFAPSFTTSGFNSNPAFNGTAGSYTVLRTWKTFSVCGTETLSLDVELALTTSYGTATMPPGSVLEFGLGIMSTSSPYEWFDGAYVRITPGSLYLVTRNNSNVDTNVSGDFLVADGTGKNAFAPVLGRKYQFTIYLTTRAAKCWISDPITGASWLAATVKTAPGFGSVVASSTCQASFRHYQPSATLGSGNLTVGRYSIRRGGQAISSREGKSMTRCGDNINSPGTLTTTANQTITTGSITRPAAAALSNTTQALNTLSCIHLETPSLASGTDGILMAYLNPALQTAIGTTFLPTRRLRIDGVRIGAFVQAALTGGPLVKSFYIAYGSTTLSLAGVTADAAAAKRYRRVMLNRTEAYVATQAVYTLPTVIGDSYCQLTSPIYVNPGEYVCLVCCGTGTPFTVGTIQRSVSFDFTWE